MLSSKRTFRGYMGFDIFAISAMNLYELLCIINVLFATGQQHIWESFACT